MDIDEKKIDTVVTALTDAIKANRAWIMLADSGDGETHSCIMNGEIEEKVSLAASVIEDVLGVVDGRDRKAQVAAFWENIIDKVLDEDKVN